MLTLQMFHFYSPLKVRPCDEWRRLIEANSASSGSGGDADDYHIGTINLSVQLMVLCGTHCTHGPALNRISNTRNQKRDLDENVFVEIFLHHESSQGWEERTSNWISLSYSHDTVIFQRFDDIVALLRSRTFFPVSTTSSKARFQIIHWFVLVRAQTLGWNKSLGCKQSSPDFKHVTTAARPFVII